MDTGWFTTCSLSDSSPARICTQWVNILRSDKLWVSTDSAGSVVRVETVAACVISMMDNDCSMGTECGIDVFACGVVSWVGSGIVAFCAWKFSFLP